MVIDKIFRMIILLEINFEGSFFIARQRVIVVDIKY